MYGTLLQNYSTLKRAANYKKQTGRDSLVYPIAMQMRRVVETSADYESASNFLKNADSPTGNYVVLTGKTNSQGIVLTRDRFHSDTQTVTSQEAYNEDWYILQTNYDWWNEAPYEHRNTTRRAGGRQAMNDIGENSISSESLFKVFSTWPVENRHTIYTTIMIPATGFYETKLRYNFSN